MRRLAAAAMERIVRHAETLPEQPAADVEGAIELARSLAEPVPEGPEAGGGLDELLALLFERAVPKSFNTASPGYLGFVPGGGLFASAVADLVADSVNRFTGVFAAAPALVQLEANAIRWLAEIVGYPPESRGLLTSGGSLASFTALVTARRERLPEDFLSGVIYISDQCHHCLPKAAALAGFPASAVRRIPTDERFRVRMDALADAVAEDRRRGRTPFLVVANAGTVNTGAVDPLPELARLAREEGLWLHADAAYGGFFRMTDRGRETLAGLELADSIVLDPHKGLFLPYGNGALLVRDGAALRRAHAFGADYLPEDQDDPDLYDPHLDGPELSKPYRGLRVWLPLKLYGLAAFRDALDEKLDLARWAADELARTEHVRLVAGPDLSLFAFRVEPPGASVEEHDALGRRVIERVNAGKRVFLTGTVLPDGRHVIRLCVLSFRTHRDRVEAALEDLRRAISELTSVSRG
jgi:aromatic-L-amino-acid decarboxylase